MSDLAADLLKFVGSVAALSWLAKALVTQWLSKDLDRHKERLAAQSAGELERLRAELQAVVREREIRFEALHAKRVAGIVDLFAALRKSLVAAEFLSSLLEGLRTTRIDEPLKRLGDSLLAATAQHAAQELYLEQSLLGQGLCLHLRSTQGAPEALLGNRSRA